jgi:tRNA-dihydrouridine synthase 3
LQRYHKLANWEYILQAAQSQDPTIRRIPIIGNGDILSWEDWNGHQHMLESNLHNLSLKSQTLAPNAVGADPAECEGDGEVLGLCNCAMIARGALIKPWLPMEIKEQRSIDMPATERLEMLKKFWCVFCLFRSMCSLWVLC